jgi:hypothetical protein
VFITLVGVAAVAAVAAAVVVVSVVVMAVNVVVAVAEETHPIALIVLSLLNLTPDVLFNESNSA